MQFVPLWTCIKTSRKVAALPDDLYRLWTLCLLVAQDYDRRAGTLPPPEDLSYELHFDIDVTVSRLSRLVTAGFIECRDGVYSIHDWDDWKHRPDPTGAARKRAQRERERQKEQEVASQNGVHDPSEDVTVTPVTSRKSQCHAPTDQTRHTPAARAGVCVSDAGAGACGDAGACEGDGEVLEPFEPPPEPPEPTWTAEQRRVLAKATRWWGASCGDSVVGGLLRLYPAALVDQAIDSHHGKVQGCLNPARLEGLCRAIWAGGAWQPEKRAGPGTSGGKPAPAINGADYYHVARPLPPEDPRVAEAGGALRILKGHAS